MNFQISAFWIPIVTGWDWIIQKQNRVLESFYSTWLVRATVFSVCFRLDLLLEGARRIFFIV